MADEKHRGLLRRCVVRRERRGRGSERGATQKNTYATELPIPPCSRILARTATNYRTRKKLLKKILSISGLSPWFLTIRCLVVSLLDYLKGELEFF
jgi:hypothetical protein